MYVSIKEVIYQLGQLCDAHKQVNSYYHGTNIVELYKEHEITHTTVLSSAQSAVIEPTFINVTLQIAVLDKTLKGDENANDVESNTLSIIGDLINYINYADEWRYAKVVTNPTATKLVERSLDVCSGWVANIQFRLLKDNGICDIPMDAITPIPTCLPATITDSDGVTIYEVVSGGSFTCTPALVPAGTALKRPPQTGAILSYRDGDDYDNLINNPPPAPPANPAYIQDLDVSVGGKYWNTLLYNNEHGNTIRYTDSAGSTPNGAVEGTFFDHLTGLELVYATYFGNWDDAVDHFANLSLNGNSDYFCLDFEQLRSLWFQYGRFRAAVYTDLGSATVNLRSSSTRYDLTTYALTAPYTTGGGNILKTNNYTHIGGRWFA